MRDYLVFSTPDYDYFAERLCRFDGFARGKVEHQSFPDGERYHRMGHRVRGRDLVLVGGTHNDTSSLDMFDIGCGLVQQGANSLIMVVPYFGYSTMDRKTRSGEIVTAKNRALLLSSIPRARVCNEVVLMDLHTAGITHYFEGHARPFHISAMDLVAGVVAQFDGDIVLASTDAGRAKWVETLARRMALPAAFVYKHRLSGAETEIRGINADVRGKHVVIYDDMIRTGGSLISAAHAYRDAGASKVSAISSHGVLPGDAAEKIEKCGHFDRLIVTDTHPRAVELAKKSSFLEISSMVPATAEFLMTLRT